MRPLVSAGEMQEIDRRAEAEFGLPGLLLMENAGIKAVARLTGHEWRDGLPAGPFVFAAGRGNNGGDALVMARQFHLQGQENVSVLLAHGEPSPDSNCGRNLAVCRSLGLPVRDWTGDPEGSRAALASCAVLFDGLTGTGLAGAAAGPVAELIKHINTLSAFTVAIDAPSGTSGAFREGFPAVPADLTLTFGLPKDFLYFHRVRPWAGRIVTVPIGFPPALVRAPSLPGALLEPKDFFAILPPLPGAAHKGTRGHLAVFAGSPGKSGAAALASLAAARSRAGLVTLYTDPAVYQPLAARLISVMMQAQSGSEAAEKDFTARYRALLIGPGFGLDHDKAALFRNLSALPLPRVIDADGLTLLAAAGSAAPAGSDAPLILTPHPGECARLLSTTVDRVLDDPLTCAREVSAAYRAVCVLKGHVTFITQPDGRYAVVDGMNPALGTAGSGDVLAGLIAGFLVQTGDPVLSARLGVLLHARLGELAFRSRGFFLAEDLLEFMGDAFTPPPDPP
jgi:hydroxyethylthiazole kinase-like uncharacterized protein yjeF